MILIITSTTRFSKPYQHFAQCFMGSSFRSMLSPVCREPGKKSTPSILFQLLHLLFRLSTSWELTLAAHKKTSQEIVVAEKLILAPFWAPWNYVVYVIPKSFSHVGLLGCFDKKNAWNLAKPYAKPYLRLFLTLAKLGIVCHVPPEGYTSPNKTLH